MPRVPAVAVTGAVTATTRTGAAVVVVVAVFVTAVAPSPVSDSVADVVWGPAVVENATVTETAPRVVPGAIGVVAVDVQVSTVSPVPSTQVHPAGLGAEVNVAPEGAVTETVGSA